MLKQFKYGKKGRRLVGRKHQKLRITPVRPQQLAGKKDKISCQQNRKVTNRRQIRRNAQLTTYRRFKRYYRRQPHRRALLLALTQKSLAVFFNVNPKGSIKKDRRPTPRGLEFARKNLFLPTARAYRKP